MIARERQAIAWAVGLLGSVRRAAALSRGCGGLPHHQHGTEFFSFGHTRENNMVISHGSGAMIARALE